MDVGVRLLVVALHRLENLSGFWLDGGGVEVDEGVWPWTMRRRMGKSPRSLLSSVNLATSRPSRPLQHESGGVTHFMRVERDVGLQPLEQGRDGDGGGLLQRTFRDELDQEIGGGGADGAAVATVPRVRQATIGDPALDANAIPAQRVDVPKPLPARAGCPDSAGS